MVFHAVNRDRTDLSNLVQEIPNPAVECPRILSFPQVSGKHGQIIADAVWRQGSIVTVGIGLDDLFLVAAAVRAALLFELCLKPLYIFQQLSWIYLLWNDEPTRVLSGHWEHTLG